MRHYETIYIMNPNLGDEEYREAVDKFNTFISSNKGVVIKTQEWGKQRLAYLIQKFNYGTYVFIEYCADAGVSAGLERAFKLDDRILKCQTIKLADSVDPEALIQKEKDAQEKNAPEEEQTVQEEAATAPEETSVTQEEPAIIPEETSVAQEETTATPDKEKVTENTDSEVANGVSEK